ncbi:MAG: hypothetical protein AAGJ32_08965 [Pseudomonadota bacterium]
MDLFGIILCICCALLTAPRVVCTGTRNAQNVTRCVEAGVPTNGLTGSIPPGARDWVVRAHRAFAFETLSCGETASNNRRAGEGAVWKVGQAKLQDAPALWPAGCDGQEYKRWRCMSGLPGA